MKNLIIKRSSTALCLLFISTIIANAQLKDVNFLRSGPSDAGKIIAKYVSPYANAFGAGLNGGWYNTAKPHKFGGFDITTNLSVAIVPTSATTYSVSGLGLSSNTTISGTGIGSTIAGPNSSSTTLDYKVSGFTAASYKTPEGLNWRYVPAPTLQLGLGLPFGTEVKARYLPKITVGNNGDISLWGVGLMHSIMQYIPGNKMLPLDLSVFGAYTKLTGNIHMNITPDPSYINNIPASTSFSGQNMNLTVTAWTVNAIASVNLKVITFYGGIGYASNQTAMKLKGNIPIPVAAPAAAPTHIEYNSTGVIDGSEFSKNLKFDDFKGVRANVGFRLKLAVITIHADYTRALYNVVSAGLGISFR